MWIFSLVSLCRAFGLIIYLTVFIYDYPLNISIYHCFGYDSWFYISLSENNIGKIGDTGIEFAIL